MGDKHTAPEILQAQHEGQLTTFSDQFEPMKTTV